MTSFIGRERELVDVERLIGRARLLTLTGAGGSGKTRLALEAAQRVRPEYPDGVWFVDLAAVGESLLVADAVSEALGLDSGAAPKPRAGAGRPTAATLTADRAGQLRTPARGLLRISSPRCSPDAPGSTCSPPAGSRSMPTGSTPSGCRHWPCRSPLRDRRSRPGRAGPAALGPAFRRAGSAGPAGFRARRRQRAGRDRPVPTARRDAAGPGVGRGQDRRTRTGRDRPADWAMPCPCSAADPTASPGTRRCAARWNGATTCSPSRRRSCCAGCRCSRAVSPSPLWRRSALTRPSSTIELLDLLAKLVDKSLVVTEKTAAGTRYRQLETVRQFGHENLDQAGETAQLAAAHCAYFLAFAVAHNPERATGVVIEQPKLLDREHDNLRAALRWSCAHDPETALRLAPACGGSGSSAVTRSREPAGSSAPWRWLPSRPGPARPP